MGNGVAAIANIPKHSGIDNIVRGAIFGELLEHPNRQDLQYFTDLGNVPARKLYEGCPVPRTCFTFIGRGQVQTD
jgi:hypothetical protein